MLARWWGRAVPCICTANLARAVAGIGLRERARRPTTEPERPSWVGAEEGFMCFGPGPA